LLFAALYKTACTAIAKRGNISHRDYSLPSLHR
jgi:hypothetical protein